jgi:hypothetical protein
LLRHSVAVVIALSGVEPLNAESIFAVGIGTQSCATWLSTKPRYRDGQNWILGYFSASNQAATEEPGRMVGSRENGPRIIAEVEKVCQKQPSMLLLEAASETYNQMRDGHLIP